MPKLSRAENKRKAQGVERFSKPLVRRHLWDSSVLLAKQGAPSVGPCKVRMLLGALVMPALVSVAAVDLCEAASAIPGEGQMGIPYAIAHLHPAAYLIFFLIFVLSALNLVYQFRVAGPGWVNFWNRKSRSRSRANGSGGSSGNDPNRDREAGRNVVGIHPPPNDASHGGGANVRRISADTGVFTGQPTPLQGTDHRLPRFSDEQTVQPGAPRLVDVGDEHKDSSGPKFSATADLFQPEESQDPELEQLVVSGTVQRPDGKRVPEVIVFLADEKGKRVGQSCVSRPVTGEYKVTAPAPGRYVLKGHKRGLVLESSEPPVLLVESGIVESYTLRMIPEGCVILGSVASDSEQDSLSDLQVKCICETNGLTRSSRTDHSGQFRIDGVAHDSTCLLEVRDSSGDVLGATPEFQTFLEKEIYKEIKLTKGEEPDEAVPAQEVTPLAGWDEHDDSESVPVDQPPVGR